MGKIKLFVGIFLLCVGNVFAGQHWKTHFAYNSVQLIAMDEKEVYALAEAPVFA